jgi:hypothetical protein
MGVKKVIIIRSSWISKGLLWSSIHHFWFDRLPLFLFVINFVFAEDKTWGMLVSLTLLKGWQESRRSVFPLIPPQTETRSPLTLWLTVIMVNSVLFFSIRVIHRIVGVRIKSERWQDLSSWWCQVIRSRRRIRVSEDVILFLIDWLPCRFTLRVKT